MDWQQAVILAAIVVAYLLFKRLGQLSPRAARKHLEKGATIIDVRTEAEFAAGHLRQAINMPMDRIEALAPQRLEDRNRILLLYCQSGSRSAASARKLTRMGYLHVFNLGSIARATRIAGA